MLGHHVALLEAELTWIKDFIEEWEAQAPPEESPDLPPEPAEVPRMKQVILPHDPDSPHRVPTRSLHHPPGQKSDPEADTDLNLSPMPKQTPPGIQTPSHPEAPPDPEQEDDLGDERMAGENPDEH
jgi:hypothetical protein